MKLKLYKANEKNLKALVTMYQTYYHDEGEHWDEKTIYQRFRQILLMPDSIFYLASINEQVVGFIMGYYRFFSDGPILYVAEILVKKEFQGQHLGSEIMAFVEKEARNAKAKAIILETLDDHLHNHFYDKLGFETKKELVFKKKILN